MRSKFYYWLISSFFLTMSPTLVYAGNQAEILKTIDSLRNIQPVKGEENLNAVNQRMDTAWKYLTAHKDESVPLIRQELLKELAQKNDQFFLLDMASFLIGQGKPQDDPLAFQCLSAIDPQAPVIQYNTDELFRLTYHLAQGGDPAVLEQVDRLFLKYRSESSLVVPQHAMTLDTAMICVFLYGVSGPGVEKHLLEQLSLKSTYQKRLLEILCVLGSENGVEQVKPFLEGQDFDTFARSIKFMVTVGGPAGREAVLRVNPKRLDERSQKYFEHILPDVKKIDYKTYLGELQKISPAPKNFSDNELTTRLEKMYENYGKDDKLNPLNVVTSQLPTDDLIARMKGIRCRTLFRLSNEALDDVDIANTILNALQFKNHP